MPETPAGSNGIATRNGFQNGSSGKKRGAEEAGLEDERETKREKAKASLPNGTDNTIVLDDVIEEGLIVLDD